ncbi:MAG: (2Fe-2S)-binding protein [Rickettsiales bacterium]|nr:(2Fe-2S)-binding protein [Rickettsiales bacterium]
MAGRITKRLAGDLNMYVCLCNAIKEKEMLGAIQAGATCPEDVYKSLGCNPVCGRCIPMIEDECQPAVITDKSVK